MSTESEDAPTSDEIKAQIAADIEAGIDSFTDGDKSVSMMDPEKRLKVAQQLKQDELAASGSTGTAILGNTFRLTSPGAYS